jgi:pimeloyl-ACP methyl ester carboxylesterase
MVDNLRQFWSPEAEAEFNAAYEAAFQQWPVPKDDIFVPTRFGETHVIACGPKNASPLVLLNPGGGSAAIWIHNIGPLSQQCRAYAVDVIGEMNKSIPTRPIRNHNDLRDWIADLLDGLQIQSTCMIGNSNGGFFTLEAALLLPERVNKVILISPAATFIQMWAWWEHLFIPAHVIAPLIHSEGMVLKAYEWLWNGFPRDPAYARLNTISKLAGYPRYRPSRNSFSPHVFSDKELRRIQAPVLLLIGDHEVIYDSGRVIRRAARLVRGLSAVIVPNANHCSQYTAPEFVNKKILEFLNPSKS